MMDVEYFHDEVRLKGFMAYPENGEHFPGVLIAHDWSGRNDFAKKKAIELAQQGYVALAIDMYGDARIGQTNDEKQALMMPLVSNRAYLRERILSAYQLLREFERVDATKMAAIGFCFGGLCVLDLARSGAALKAVVSFHGILKDAPDCPSFPIKAEVLALHGYDDPMVTPQDVMDFTEEMTHLGAPFQVNIYGQTMHAFTNPKANDKAFGTVYQMDTAQKAFQAMDALFARVL